MTGTLIQSALITAGTSQAIEIPSGMTLVNIIFPELTSTTFTITQGLSSGGVFTTFKDPLGFLATAGSAITFTIGSTSLGNFWIPPSVAAALLPWIKIVLSSSESAGINLQFRYIS